MRYSALGRSGLGWTSHELGQVRKEAAVMYLGTGLGLAFSVSLFF